MQSVISYLRKIATAALMLASAFGANAYDAYPVVTYPFPASVNGASPASLNLDGKWQFKFSTKSGWTSVDVPGEAAMQGYAVPHDKEVVYRKKFRLPQSFAGSRTILRFNGTYSYATLIINGKYVREHRGGFSRWETDVTDWVKPGKENTIELKLIDPIEEISYGSGYAHHPICGILRSVEMFAVPDTYMTDLRVDARLDTTFTDARLHIDFNLTGKQPAKAAVTLTAPDGSVVNLGTAQLKPGLNQISEVVKKPLKWDAEHPNLYTLTIQINPDNGAAASTVKKQIGFRNIEIKGDRMLVNGMPVKLRGACRHDVDPRRGRSTDRATDSIDAVLFKQANMNWVRTSHYPPTEDFIEFCDRLGIYIECETAACFVNTHRQKNYAPGASQNDSTFTAQYLGQLDEMVKAFQTHPSILFWSVGNESQYGSNFQKSYDRVKAYDTTRPVIWSYPGYQPDGTKPIYDILSMHYPAVDGNLWQVGKQTRGFQGEGIPALFDEWAHPACYTFETLRNDPGIREFWGKSLDMMWDGVYNAPGALGGAIWGYIDDVFMLPDPKAGEPYWIEFARSGKPVDYTGKCVGYGDWGIIDIWRRPKPEFWATKKAYTPVKVLDARAIDAAPGQPVYLTVMNRFDHTNLNEIKASVFHKGTVIPVAMPDLMPHGKATLVIPGSDWQRGDSLRLTFTTATGRDTIDSYLFTIGDVKAEMPRPASAGTSLNVSDSGNSLTITGDGFTVPFSKSTGLITNATVRGIPAIASGPYFNGYVNLNHLSGAEVRKIADHVVVDPDQWKLTSLTHRRNGADIMVDIKGTYGDVSITFNIIITPQGEMTTAYNVEGLPNGFLREEGLMFRLPDSYNKLSWQRRGYWDDYPADAMSGNKGSVSLYNPKVVRYGQKPRQAWRDDTHDYFYWADRGANCDRPLTMAAKAMKEDIEVYTLSGACNLSVISPKADVACRLATASDSSLSLYADNRWDYPEIAWGNYCKTLEALPCHGSIRLLLGHR